MSALAKSGFQAHAFAMLRGLLIRALLALGALCAGAEQARAACLAAPQMVALEPPGDVAVQDVDVSVGGRVVAPVMVNGAGPFRFIIDTGANRTVLSAGLAERLGLTPQGAAEVHSINGVETAPLAPLTSLAFGNLDMAPRAAPVLTGPVFAGAHGLLGVDGLTGMRLTMDMVRRCVEIAPARTPVGSRDWTHARGELRFNNLVVVPALIGGVHANVLIDTGSTATLANSALREALGVAPVARLDDDTQRAYTAGRPVVLEHYMVIPRLDVGDVTITNVAAHIGDFHIFDLWGLADAPTLLVGMDVLSQTRAVAIDYRRASVHFRIEPPPREPNADVGVRFKH